MRNWIGAACCLLTLGGAARAQGTAWNETWVGSDWEIYARALADRGLLGTEPWSIRPFAPSVIDGWQTQAGAAHPWQSRMQTAVARHVLTILRPSVSTSYNSGYAWGLNDGPVWQGRGLNTWATAGVALHYGILTVRLEPLVEYAQNRPFELAATPAGASPYVDDMRPTTIDLPQRFGNSSFQMINPGQSVVRIDYHGAALGFSTEDIFWGPGVRQALLFDGNASGFPHAFIGTSHAVATPLGRFHAQLIYGRLEESDWAPQSLTTSRFGAGAIAVWMPPTPASAPIELGVARFYHRPWPDQLGKSELLAPFGSFFRDKQTFGGGITDNQLLSLFGTIRVPAAGFELFGEFGRNDRSVDTRDAIIELEHNSAWMLGFFDVVGPQTLENGFWTVRAEIGNGRIPALQQIGRAQTTFYDHSRITQGHTEDGQLLGSPLIDRSGGIDFAVDRWNSRGRFGVNVFERQMPPDEQLGMPSSQDRSQWDTNVSGTAFVGSSDLSVAAGHVLDINRFVMRDIGSWYLRLQLRAGLP